MTIHYEGVTLETGYWVPCPKGNPFRPEAGKNPRLTEDPRGAERRCLIKLSARKVSNWFQTLCAWPFSIRVILSLSMIIGSAPVAPGQEEPAAAGMALARQLRALKPAHEVRTSGVLRIRDAQGKRTEVPVRFEVLLGTNSWRSLYELQRSSPSFKQTLLVVHAPDGPNQYFLAQMTAAEMIASEMVPLGGGDIFQSFGGSDFWLADLGLEFLHWPGQRLVKTEMRRGRSCRVLESLASQPARTAYDRVVSWVDIETGGIVRAEAYRSGNQLIKEFSLRSVQKGQLKEMQLRSPQTDSVSRLEFDLDLEGVPEGD